MTIEDQVVNYLNQISERDNCDSDSPEYAYFDSLSEYTLRIILDYPNGYERFNQLIEIKSFRSANGFSGGHNA